MNLSGLRHFGAHRPSTQKPRSMRPRSQQEEAPLSMDTFIPVGLGVLPAEVTINAVVEVKEDPPAPAPIAPAPDHHPPGVSAWGPGSIWSREHGNLE